MSKNFKQVFRSALVCSNCQICFLSLLLIFTLAILGALWKGPVFCRSGVFSWFIHHAVTWACSFAKKWSMALSLFYWQISDSLDIWSLLHMAQICLSRFMFNHFLFQMAQDVRGPFPSDTDPISETLRFHYTLLQSISLPQGRDALVMSRTLLTFLKSLKAH